MKIMKIIKKILFILFLIVSFAYLFIIISPKIFKNFYPFGLRVAIVLTGSMEPTLEIDDFVIIKKPNEIKENDIISYNDNRNKREILHRVIKINNDEIITKGDNNNTEDAAINVKQVTGVYIGKIKYLGKIISYITKPIVFSIIITLVLVVMFLPRKG